MQNAEKLSITLPIEMVQTIRERVRAGGYASVSEAIREALRGWMEREHRLQSLDAAIERGLTDAEAGRVSDIDAVHVEMLEHFGVSETSASA